MKARQAIRLEKLGLIIEQPIIPKSLTILKGKRTPVMFRNDPDICFSFNLVYVAIRVLVITMVLICRKSSYKLFNAVTLCSGIYIPLRFERFSVICFPARQLCPWSCSKFDRTNFVLALTGGQTRNFQKFFLV